MGKTSEQIAAEIQLKRQALHANVEELQAKVKSFTDWRRQFERHPGAMFAAAVGAGALLATLAGGRKRRRDTPLPAAAAEGLGRAHHASEHPQDGIAHQVWTPLKEALIGMAVLRITGMLEQKLPGSRESPKSARPARRAAEPHVDDPEQAEGAAAHRH